MNADVDASNEAPAASLKQKSSSLASADDPEKEAEKEQNVHPVQRVVDVEKVPESRYRSSCNQIGLKSKEIERLKYFKSLYKVAVVEFVGFDSLVRKCKTEVGRLRQLNELALKRFQHIENFDRADFIKSLFMIEEVLWKNTASFVQRFESNKQVFNSGAYYSGTKLEQKLDRIN